MYMRMQTKLREYPIALADFYHIAYRCRKASAAVCAMQCNALITPDVAENAINDEETCISGHYQLSQRTGSRLYPCNHSRSCHYHHLLLLHAVCTVRTTH